MGLELKNANWLNEAAFCKRLAALKHLRFVKLHGASAAEVSVWRRIVPAGCEVEA